MGPTCYLCTQPSNTSAPQNDLIAVPNKLKHLHPAQFYNPLTRAINNRIGKPKYLFKISELPPICKESVAMSIGPIASNGVKYYGEYNEGKKEGQGKQVWLDYTIYEGFWENDLPEYRGRMIYPNGDVYEGNWHEGKRHGKGTLSRSDGSTYIGEWEADRPHGKGIEKYDNGITYAGQYHRGKKHGEGKIEWADGKSYQGEFNSNQIDGYGTMKIPGQSVYEGQWRNNKMQGKGRIAYEDGREYVGQFQDDLFHGEGVFNWPDGKTLKTQWREGFPCFSYCPQTQTQIPLQLSPPFLKLCSMP